ncbi:AraC family transcriptional regulator [Nocardia sp. XZ_19_369]|uniref:helix-turn-helix domain-containing protein n=1 Tax=Nocardia sp. XZ_19_369 TaxID=2769487 RepID=UPI00188EBD84|nr:helix-turn-helix domain-containing protein [Nocardia sp. XZ_19_369]
MPVEPVRVAGAEVVVAVPSRPGRVAGVSMAGFRSRAKSPVELPMVPYPALTVFIDFGDVFLADAASGVRMHGGGVVGLGPAGVLGCGQEVDLLQVRLSPVVAHAVLGASSELAGTVVALEEVWQRDAARLREQLHATRSWEERFAIAEATLGRRLGEGRVVHPEIAFAWARIIKSRGQVRVERLAEEVGWSRKRLWSRFRSQIGLTPKRAAQLVRFDYAAHRLAGGDSAASVSAESGYVDQSHLYRDARSFAGLTPTALAVAPWLAVDPVAWAAPVRARPRRVRDARG